MILTEYIFGVDAMMERQPVESVMDTTLAHIKEMLDVDTVVGKPVFSEGGTVIIPLSRLGVGFAAGGAQYGDNKGEEYPFGGGGGAGMSVNPCGFLVINGGNASFLPAQQSDGLDRIMGGMPRFIEQLKGLICLFRSGETDEDEKER